MCFLPYYELVSQLKSMRTFRLHSDTSLVAAVSMLNCFCQFLFQVSFLSFGHTRFYAYCAGATNKPQELDDAVLRRLVCKIYNGSVFYFLFLFLMRNIQNKKRLKTKAQQEEFYQVWGLLKKSNQAESRETNLGKKIESNAIQDFFSRPVNSFKCYFTYFFQELLILIVEVNSPHLQVCINFPKASLVVKMAYTSASEIKVFKITDELS